MLKCFSPALGGAGVNPAVLGSLGTIGRVYHTTIRTQIHTYGAFRVARKPNVRVSGLWEEPGKPAQGRGGTSRRNEPPPPDVVPAEATLPHLITIDRPRSKYPSRSTPQTQVRMEVPDFSMEQKSCACSATAAGKQK